MNSQGETRQLTTPNQIRARLIEQNLSFRKFALEHGYEPRTVTQTVERWAGSQELPNGRISFSIMRDLSKQIGHELIPGLLDHAFAQAS